MSTEEYLYQLKDISRQITVKKKELKQLRETIGISPIEPHQGSNPGYISDPTSSSAIRLRVIEEEIEDKIDELLRLRKEITTKIEKVQEPLYRDLLTCRYILMQPWKEVSATIGHEQRYTYKLHGRALQAVEEQIEKGE